MNNRQKGKVYEEKTTLFLEEKGCQILERNYLRKTGEIDIIALSEDKLLFVEVKYRANQKFGYPTGAIDTVKRRKILTTAKWYLMENNAFEQSMRFDVAIWCDGKLTYFKGAFNYDT